MDGYGSRDKIIAGDRCLFPYPGHGPTGAASGGLVPRPGLCSPLSQCCFQGLPARNPDPLWLRGPSRAPPSQRSRTTTAVDAAAGAAVYASDRNAASASPGTGDAPGGLWYPRSSGTGLSCVWLAEPDGVCRPP